MSKNMTCTGPEPAAVGRVIESHGPHQQGQDSICTQNMHTPLPHCTSASGLRNHQVDHMLERRKVHASHCRFADTKQRVCSTTACCVPGVTQTKKPALSTAASASTCQPPGEQKQGSCSGCACLQVADGGCGCEMPLADLQKLARTAHPNQMGRLRGSCPCQNAQPQHLGLVRREGASTENRAWAAPADQHTGAGKCCNDVLAHSDESHHAQVGLAQTFDLKGKEVWWITGAEQIVTLRTVAVCL